MSLWVALGQGPEQPLETYNSSNPHRPRACHADRLLPTHTSVQLPLRCPHIPFNASTTPALPDFSFFFHSSSLPPTNRLQPILLNTGRRLAGNTKSPFTAYSWSFNPLDHWIIGYPAAMHDDQRLIKKKRKKPRHRATMYKGFGQSRVSQCGPTKSHPRSFPAGNHAMLICSAIPFPHSALYRSLGCTSVTPSRRPVEPHTSYLNSKKGVRLNFRSYYRRFHVHIRNSQPLLRDDGLYCLSW
ncbi:hypothetical protein F5Y11DRAFT_166628 [Daldinia sp. FL1419]|nr:hypothetical protein F5Y11DRAFT_166628 [Daldinia sp. FL1419]